MKAPRSWPKRVLSTRSFGIAPQLTRTMRRPLRGPLSWIIRARTSLPVPVSPCRMTGMRKAATRLTVSSSARICWPAMIPPSAGPSRASTVAAAGPCATGRSGGAEGDGSPMTEEVVIRVENDLTNPGAVTVFAVSAATGARVPLGTVSTGTGEVRFRSGAITGGYVLEAQRAGGGASLRSQRITLTGGETLTWNLRTNAILVDR